MSWFSNFLKSWSKEATNEVKEVVNKKKEEIVQKILKQNVFVLNISIEDINEESARQKLASDLGLLSLEKTEGGNWKAKTKSGIKVIITVASV